MRTLCTSDWHFGRTLEGRDRLEEQVAFVDELCEMCRDEAIDLVMVAGDVFDTYNPPALAEQLFYDCLSRLADGGRRGVVVIAGNHDAPERLTAAAPLAASHGVTLVGLPSAPISPDKPRLEDTRGRSSVFRVECGPSWVHLSLPRVPHPVVVAAVPYPSEARLKEALPPVEGDRGLQQAYSQRVGRLFGQLAERFRDDAVNLAMSHLYVSGSTSTDSERPIELGGTCSVDADVFPASASFVALGHLHRAQSVSAKVPCRYTGSPLAYSFSEAGHRKSVCIVDAEPGRDAVVTVVPLSSGRSLVRWVAEAGLAQVHAWVGEGRDRGAWIDLEVHTDEWLSSRDIQLLREQSPGLVNIRPVVRGVELPEVQSLEGLPVGDLFRLFHLRSEGIEPDAELTRLFLELVNEAQGGAQSEGTSDAELAVVGGVSA